MFLSNLRQNVRDVGLVHRRERKTLLAEMVERRARTFGRPTGLPSANLPSETQAFLRRIYMDERCLVYDEEAVVELV